MKIRHVGIVVKDWDTCYHFYTQFGFEAVKFTGEGGAFIDNVLGMDGVEIKTVKLSDSQGCILELIYFVSPKSQQGERRISDTGISHIALNVDSVSDEYIRLSSLGIGLLSTPQLSNDGRVKVMFCRDPEGNILELVEEVG